VLQIRRPIRFRQEQSKTLIYKLLNKQERAIIILNVSKSISLRPNTSTDHFTDVTHKSQPETFD
jgi:hypothetical protein